MAFDVLISVQFFVAEDRNSRERMESYFGAFRTNRPGDPLRGPAADSAAAPPNDLASLSVCPKNCVSATFCRKKSAGGSASPCSLTRYAVVPAAISRPLLHGRQFTRLGARRARNSCRHRLRTARGTVLDPARWHCGYCVATYLGRPLRAVRQGSRLVAVTNRCRGRIRGTSLPDVASARPERHPRCASIATTCGRRDR